MVLIEMQDHRSDSEPVLVEALRASEPLALAEAYYRSIGAAYGCARRITASSAETEALLRAVYTELWESPPAGEPLEGWVRRRCFALGHAHLRDVGRPPAAPSLAMVMADLPAPEARGGDALEQALGELDEPARRALLLAHDCGVASAEQEDPDAPLLLDRALAQVAGRDTEDGDQPEDLVPLLADWTLGLLPEDRAAEVSAAVGADPRQAARARLLRRGRRRLEGLPPPPDMGQRILVAVLAGYPSLDGAVGGPPVDDGTDGPTPDDGAAAPAADAEESAGSTPAPTPEPKQAAVAGSEAARSPEPHRAAVAGSEAAGSPERAAATAPPPGIITSRGLARGSWQRGRRQGGLMLRLRGGMLLAMALAHRPR